MSTNGWRQRWERYRRYGLEPLADDASPEMREERLKEIARLRRQRQRRIALRSGIGTLVLVVLAIALVWWLVSTLAGRDVLLAQIKARLPANATLEWQRAEGPVRGPMTLHGVRFSWVACADPDFDVNTVAMARCKDKRTTLFTASRVMLHPKLGALVGRRLRLEALEVSGASLDLAKDDKPFELPRWPEVLPRIEPPLAIEADRIRVDRLVIRNAGAHAIDIHWLEGGLMAESGRLAVRTLDAETDRGRFHLHGHYAPGAGFDSDLTATAVFPAPAGQTAGRIGVIARGNLEKMDVFVGGRAPAPLRATLTLRADGLDAAEAGETEWTLVGHGEGLDPAVLSGRRGGQPMAFRIDATGRGGEAELEGEWSQGENRVVMQPSRLALQAQTLHARPVVLDLLGGRLTLNGHGAFKAEAAEFKFAANARGLGWRDAAGTTQVTGEGDFGIAGTREAWAVIGNALLRRDRQQARVEIDGRGDVAGLTLRKLRATMPEGRLDANGRIDWQPETRWNLDAVLAGFDPGYFLPDFRGAVSGVVATRGQFTNGRPEAEVRVRNLGGQLRGRALGGGGELRISGEEYSGEAALTLGGSRVEASGRYGRRIDIDARFNPLRLDDLLPSAQGRLAGQLRLRGPRDGFDIHADLEGSGLRHGSYRAEALVLDGHLPWRGQGGDLRIDARGVQAGLALDRLQARATGAVENLGLEADADGAVGRMRLQGRALRRGENWSGTLASFDFAPSRGAAWRLQSPVAFAQRGSTWSLSQGCFASGEGGSLCAGGQWPGRGLEVEGRGLPLQLAAPWLPAREDGKPWLLDGSVDLDGRVRPVGNSWAGTLQARSAAGGLRLGNRGGDALVNWRDLRLDASFDPRSISARLDSGISGNGTLRARLDTGWDEFAPLAGQVDLDVRDLSFLELFVPDIVDPRGTVTGQVALSGTRGKPLVGGNAELRDLRAEVPAYGLVLTRGQLVMRAQPDGNARLTGSVRSGDGVLDIDGTLGWQGQETPVVLNVKGRDVLLSDTRDLRAVVDPDVVVRIQGGQPLNVSGRVRITSAQADLERLSDGVSRSPDVVVLDPANPARVPGSGMDMDLVLDIGDDVRMRGFGLDGQLGGSLRVRARPGREMAATGRLTVEGRYRAYGQRLDIEQGRLVWSNDPIANPVIELSARREVGDVTAGIRVSGRATAPQAEVWADPAMDQSEALAYLTLGRSLSTVTSDESRQINAASAALTAGGGMLASQLANRIGLDDAGVVQSSALGGSVFGVGKYLSPRVYVGYGVSLLGTGQVLTLKYLLRKGFDITIESSTIENKGSVNWRTER